MNRIVREHYPVSQLPEDIRREFTGQHEVTLIVSAAEAPTLPSVADKASDEDALTELRRASIQGGDFSRFKHLRRDHFRSSEEAETYLDDLRSEWAHRER